MIKKYDSHIIAVVGTLIFMAIVFLLLWFLHMTMTPPMDDKDIEVTLEYIQDVEEAPEVEDLMDVAPPQQDESASQAQSKTQPTVAKPSDSKLLTQKNQKTLPTKEPTDTIVERTENVDVNKQKEKNAKELVTDVLARSAQLEDSEQQPPVEEPEEETENTGSGFKGDISWSLKGRGCNLLKKPDGSVTEIGRIVVEIIVDKDGNVISAKVTHKGTTISDRVMQQMAVNAALNTRFTPATATQPEKQMGTITYEYIDKKS